MNLYIDTHLNDIVIVLGNNEKILKEEIISGEKEISKLIMPTIKKVLGDTKPDSIIVCNGPGSFTGVRLGVTIAKTLSYTLQVPIRTISALECLAISLENRVDKIVGFSDKNGYYIGIFEEDMSKIGSYEYLSNKEFEEYKSKHNVYTEIEQDYLKIIAYALSKSEKNPHEINPEYIKKIDVEK